MIAKIARKPRPPQASSRNTISSRVSERQKSAGTENMLSHYKTNALKKTEEERKAPSMGSPKLHGHSMYDRNDALRKSGPLRSLHRTDLKFKPD